MTGKQVEVGATPFYLWPRRKRSGELGTDAAIAIHTPLGSGDAAAVPT